jgi:GNAT superfamily N-acetyltransferase
MCAQSAKQLSAKPLGGSMKDSEGSFGGPGMKVTTRAYDPESKDFKALCHFIIQDNRVKEEYFVWQLGRIVDWKYGLWKCDKFFQNFFTKNAQLWFDYFDELVGFAISENGDNMFYVFVKDAYAYLHEEIVLWVMEHWEKRDGALCTEVTEKQTAQMQTLEKQGFISKGVAEITRMYKLTEILTFQPVLEDGYELVDMATHYDPVGIAKLKANAFRNQDSVSEIDLLTNDYVRESPIYKPEFDLSIINPQGEYIAGCEAFIDYDNQVAEIERVCTHSAYRRKGLANAVIQACFDRLKNHGIPMAFITGMSKEAINLYGKLDFAKEINRVHFELGD